MSHLITYGSMFENHCLSKQSSNKFSHKLHKPHILIIAYLSDLIFQHSNSTFWSKTTTLWVHILSMQIYFLYILICNYLPEVPFLPGSNLNFLEYFNQLSKLYAINHKQSFILRTQLCCSSISHCLYPDMHIPIAAAVEAELVKRLFLTILAKR